MREKFHRLMIAIMKEEEDKVEEIKQELITTLNTATEQERRRFVGALLDTMRLWAYELEKARRLRKALKEFLDDNTYRYEEDEGESDTFYNYYI
ncbi:MAG: hypothetical protein JHC25_04060 [Thermodesulfobacterium sp.]|jgi:RNA binding exosome subunit|nr:hypothetical protein [Thermodesulfobacterium sp.]